MNKVFAAMRRWVDRAEFDTSAKAIKVIDKSDKLPGAVKKAKKAEKKSRQR